MPQLESPQPPSLLVEIDQLNQEAWEGRLNSRNRTLELSQSALALAKAEGYRCGLGYALRNLGFCEYATGNYEEALTTLSESLTLAHRLGDQLLERDCLNYIGAVYAGMGELETALEYVEKTYRLNLGLSDEAGVAFSLNNIGILYHQMGRDEESIQVKLEGIKLARKLQDPVREAFTLCNLVPSYIALKRLEEAIQTSQQTLELCRRLQLNDLEIKVLVNLGETLGLQGNYRTSLEVLEQAFSQAYQSGSKELLVNCWLTMATVYLGQGSYAQALEVLRQGLGETQALGAKELEFLVHQRLAQTYKALGDFATALEHFQIYHQLEQEVRTQSAERKLRVMGIQRELDQAKAEAEIERLRSVELARALEALEQANREKTTLLHQLEARTAELALKVIQDPLTRLYNRRYLEESLANEFGQAWQMGWPLSIAIMDVDNFKQVNDNFSHLVGDMVLQTVAGIIQANARSTDIVARYGGEEFVLVLPRTAPEAAIRVCERIRQAVEDHNWSNIHPNLGVTLSLGLCSDIGLPNHEKMLDAADTKLYQAKRAGKNRIKY